MKKILLAVVGVLVVAVLVFTAVSTWRTQQTTNEPTTLTMPILASEDENGESEVTVGVSFESAPELPTEPIAAWGVLLRESNNSYLVGSGPNFVQVDEVDGELQPVPHHEGPEVEVVVTQDTLFYEDVTNMERAENTAVSTEMTMQQQVRPVPKPDALPTVANLLVWGERTGERVVAEVIVFTDAGY